MQRLLAIRMGRVADLLEAAVAAQPAEQPLDFVLHRRLDVQAVDLEAGCSHLF
jgi:hypothetical protein